MTRPPSRSWSTPTFYSTTTGSTPDGEGVGGRLTVFWLGQYPDYETSIFDRENPTLTQMRDYQMRDHANHWVVSASRAPEDIYFYVIALGNGDARSGYLQTAK